MRRKRAPARTRGAGHACAAGTRRLGGAAVLAPLVLLWPQPSFAQCAMCRTALGSPEGRQLIAALQQGIVLLLAVPLGLVVAIAVLAIRSQRRLTADPAAECTPAAAAAPGRFMADRNAIRSMPTPGDGDTIGADAL